MKSSIYVSMMTCWGTHHCQETRPQPAGSCAAFSIDEGVQEIDTMEELSGDWWVVSAWNCEASAITFAKCQKWQINQTENHLSFAIPTENGLVYKELHQYVHLAYNGVLRATYDASNGAVRLFGSFKFSNFNFSVSKPAPSGGLSYHRYG